MVFSSLLFVFAFLPIQLLVYYLTPKRYRNVSLLAFSLIFYGWSGPGYILLLAGESLVSFVLARSIEKSDDKKKKGYMILECIILLSVLVFFKYLSFGAQCINGLIGLWSDISIPLPAIVLPIGISFYTFQLISYVADVYMGKVKASDSFFKVFLYASLFHQCIAGPIVRYETIANEIDERKADINDIFAGASRFAVGLAKKAVLANACAAAADALFGESASAIATQPVLGLWLGAVFYTLQIYLDFSAYSDMAIGMGRCLGFHYLENFNYPYISDSVTEFWRRWHMSLSTFFRDYVYIPLGGNRVKPFRHIINLLVVWFLTGLWHGASVNFIMWGLYYFLFLIAEKYIKIGLPEKVKKVLGHILTVVIVTFGWVIFRFDDTDNLLVAVKGMLGIGGNQLWSLNAKTVLLNNVFLLIFSIIASTPLFKYIYTKMKASEKSGVKVITSILEVIIPVSLILVAAFALAGNSYNPFLYFRF